MRTRVIILGIANTRDTNFKRMLDKVEGYSEDRQIVRENALLSFRNNCWLNARHSGIHGYEHPISTTVGCWEEVEKGRARVRERERRKGARRTINIVSP